MDRQSEEEEEWQDPPDRGEDYILDARKVVTFKSSNVLRDPINSGD
jgi:hypothetical protein